MTTTSPASATGLMPQDVEHLRLLTIFHYVVAGLQALVACFPLIHLTVGLAMIFGSRKAGPSTTGAETWVGWLFVALAAAFILLGWSVAACTLVAGRALAARRRYVFCTVVAAVNSLMCMPFGTALGVCTILVLMRPTVKAAFGRPV
jgi:hypothetical protein